MTKYKLLFLALLFSLIANAQDSLRNIKGLPKNNIGVNIVGEASLIALNYERNFLLKSPHFINLSVGIGINEEFTLFTSGKEYLTFPHHLTYNIGRKKHFFEIGIGGTGLIDRKANFASYYIYPIAGYRFQSIRQGKLFFRTYLAWLFQTNEKKTGVFLIPVGVAIGVTF